MLTPAGRPPMRLSLSLQEVAGLSVALQSGLGRTVVIIAVMVVSGLESGPRPAIVDRARRTQIAAHPEHEYSRVGA